MKRNLIFTGCINVILLACFFVSDDFTVTILVEESYGQDCSLTSNTTVLRSDISRCQTWSNDQLSDKFTLGIIVGVPRP